MGGPAIIDGYVVPATDNFFKCRFIVNSKQYCSAQSYFQAHKTLDEGEHDTIRKSGPGEEAWLAGSKATLRADWDAVKVNVMYEGNLAKFSQNPDLAENLTSTKGPISHEQGFWGRWNCRILERIRAELRKNGPEDELKAKQIKQIMEEYAKGNKTL